MIKNTTLTLATRPYSTTQASYPKILVHEQVNKGCNKAKAGP